MILKTEELQEIHGSGFGIGTFLGIGGFFVFLIGVVDGYLHPKKCGE